MAYVNERLKFVPRLEEHVAILVERLVDDFLLRFEAIADLRHASLGLRKSDKLN